MTDKVIKDNQVTITGEIVSGFSYSHQIYNEGFYMMDVKTLRLSGNFDIIPVMVSERLLDKSEDHSGRLVCVTGQFRSYNRHEGRRNKLVLYVFAREVEFVPEVIGGAEDNKIYLDGYICKDPISRDTPLGRNITDLLIAINRPYGKSDYIPCICWGRNAHFASGFSVGDRVQIWGRIQSREYIKQISEDVAEKRVAYEVSISKMNLAEEKSEADDR